MRHDNPAARLLSIIEQGKQINPNSNCREIWQDILGVKNNNPLLISRLGKVMELPQLIIKSLQENSLHHEDTWSHWESQVNSAFMQQNLNSNWLSFISHIDSHSITYLRLASELIAAKSNTRSLSEDEVKSIRDSLAAILEEVISSSIDEGVRNYLYHYIQKIIVAIDEYRFTGALPLLETIESTIGHAHLHAEYKNFLTDTQLGKRLLDTLGSMANVVTVAIGLPQLSQSVLLLTGAT